jgi:hypothetical protein
VSKESQKREDRLAAAIRHAAARRATEDAVCRHITELFQQKITAAARRPSGGRMTFVIKS